MKFFNNIFLLGCLATMFIMTGCDKTKVYDTTYPPTAAHFTGDSVQRYHVIDTTAVQTYYIGVGTTDVSNVDRIITYTIISTSGAVLGTDYNVTGTGTVTIKAGTSIDSIGIQPNLASYGLGEKDTLIIALTEPSLEVASFQDTVKFIILGIPLPTSCSEDAVTMSEFLGDYANTIETFGTGAPYGPYNTTITAATLTGATSGRISVTNIFDTGWGAIEFLLDWSDPNNRTAIVVPATAVPNSDAGDLNPTYAGQTVAVKVPSAALSSTPGTYSFCDKTFTLKMQLGVTALGYFNALYTVTMAQ